MSTFKRAFLLSLSLHFFLAAALIWLERPKPTPWKVIRLKLTSVSPPEITTKASSLKKPSVQKTPLKSLRKRSVPPKRASSKSLTSKRVARKKPPEKRVSRALKKALRPKRPSSRKTPTLSRREEARLRERLAALKSRLEERKLQQKLAQLKKSQTAGELSLGTGLPERFAQRLMAHLKSFWAVPEVLKDRTDLSAEVELTIAPNGELLSYRFIRRSGEALFDEAVEATLKKASPLPAPGKTLTIPAVFKIK